MIRSLESDIIEPDKKLSEKVTKNVENFGQK